MSTFTFKGIEIDIDEEKRVRPLSIREKIGIRMIYLIFRMIYPAKFTHQVNNLEEFLFKDL